MKKEDYTIVMNIFKIGWGLCLLFSLYILFWMVFMSFLTQSLDNDKGENLTWINFIIPNIASLILLGLYTKEILVGYKPKTRNRNLVSLAIVLIVSIGILITQVEFYKWLIEGSGKEWFIIIPIVLIVTSIIGLIFHRIDKMKEILHVEN